LPRIRVTISKEAQDSLMELQRRMNKPPAAVINELLVEQYRARLDDELCKKEFFSSCIIYQVQMPFCFPHECECFNFHSNNRGIRLYLERVPKRHVTYRLPFITQATIIIKLDDKKDFPKNQVYARIKDIIIERTNELAFNLLKKIIIHYRRVTEDYYNIGVIKPPMNLEEFKRNTHITIIQKDQIYSILKTMPVKEDSKFVVMHKLDDNVRTKIMDAVNQKESEIFFSVPYDFLDQSIISYYDEEWNLCLIQGVIAMESALSRLVIKGKLTSDFSRSRKRSKKPLIDAYKDAPGLPQKICKFLFPILREKNMIELEDKLRKIMPLIRNKKTEMGVYDLRSKVVHEGLSISEKEAKITIDIVVPQFFEILNSILD